jgi:hypothetical protein
MPQLRIPEAPLNQACVRLTFAEWRFNANIVGLGVRNITGAPRLNGGTNRYRDFCSKLVVVEVMIKLRPNHVEQSERAVAGALPRRPALDPPGRGSSRRLPSR